MQEFSQTQAKFRGKTGMWHDDDEVEGFKIKNLNRTFQLPVMGWSHNLKPLHAVSKYYIAEQMFILAGKAALCFSKSYCMLPYKIHVKEASLSWHHIASRFQALGGQLSKRNSCSSEEFQKYQSHCPSLIPCLSEMSNETKIFYVIHKYTLRTKTQLQNNTFVLILGQIFLCASREHTPVLVYGKNQNR